MFPFFVVCRIDCTLLKLVVGVSEVELRKKKMRASEDWHCGERQIDRQTDSCRQRHRQRQGHTNKQTVRYGHTDRETDRQADGRIDRQRQADRQTEK